MRGLVAVRESGVHIVNFWDTEHAKIPEFHQSGDREEWAEYDELRSGNGPHVLRLYQGATGPLYNRDWNGNQGGDGMVLLAPIPKITHAENAKASPNFNNLSYVLLLHHAGKRIILGGDAEKPVWEHLFQQLGDSLKCDVLIAPHHGRESAFHNEAVKAMSPDYTIVSVGKKPETDASNKYRKHSKHVWSTRWRGNIVIDVSPSGILTVIPQFSRGDDLPGTGDFLNLIR